MNKKINHSSFNDIPTEKGVHIGPYKISRKEFAPVRVIPIVGAALLVRGLAIMYLAQYAVPDLH